jgi:hypothetical protein
MHIIRGLEWEGVQLVPPPSYPYYYIVCNNSSDPEGSVKDDIFSFILSNISCLIRILNDGDSHHEELSTRTFYGRVQN